MENHKTLKIISGIGIIALLVWLLMYFLQQTD